LKGLPLYTLSRRENGVLFDSVNSCKGVLNA
jgi:hypothetical protein